eukprot:857796-Alexandrium_andersonii.AAC.1
MPGSATPVDPTRSTCSLLQPSTPDGAPLVIYQANMQEKDGGTILEKKQLVVQLLLGLPRTLARRVGECLRVRRSPITRAAAKG